MSVEKRVGLALKRFRTENGWSTRELAARSGVSAAMISEVERAGKSPTITILSALAAALQIPLSRLVGDTVVAPRLVIVRAKDHQTLIDAGGAQRSSLGPMLGNSRVEFVRLVLAPRGGSGYFAPHPIGATERVHIVSGNVRAVLGDEAHDLAPGDTVVFAGDVEHEFNNLGDDEATMFLVIDHGRGEGVLLPLHS